MDQCCVGKRVYRYDCDSRSYIREPKNWLVSRWPRAVTCNHSWDSFMK